MGRAARARRPTDCSMSGSGARPLSHRRRPWLGAARLADLSVAHAEGQLLREFQSTWPGERDRLLPLSQDEARRLYGELPNVAVHLPRARSGSATATRSCVIPSTSSMWATRRNSEKRPRAGRAMPACSGPASRARQRTHPMPVASARTCGEIDPKAPAGAARALNQTSKAHDARRMDPLFGMQPGPPDAGPGGQARNTVCRAFKVRLCGKATMVVRAASSALHRHGVTCLPCPQPRGQVRTAAESRAYAKRPA
jgi:hypothetical protein